MIKLFLLTLLYSSFALAQVNRAVNDGQILRVLVTINESEIEAARIANVSARNQDVKLFARMMVEDHEINTKDIQKISRDTGLFFIDSELSDVLRNDMKISNRTMQQTSDTSFDSAYIDQQIEAHEKVLAIIDQTLLIGVQTSELKVHLEKTRSPDEFPSRRDHSGGHRDAGFQRPISCRSLFAGFLGAGRPAAQGLDCGPGRGRGTRTHDLRFWRPPLYQLSYTPLGLCGVCLISPLPARRGVKRLACRRPKSGSPGQRLNGSAHGCSGRPAHRRPGRSPPCRRKH